jgi:hypothetical protein
LRTIAAGEAALAQLIIISVHHAETLPEGVKGWIDLWLGQSPCRNSSTAPLTTLALIS